MIRKKQLTQEQKDEIKRLCDSGMSQKSVAIKFGRNAATICYIANGKRTSTGPSGRVYVCKTPEAKEVEFEDFSKLPTTVLFNPKHFPSF